MNRLLLNKKAQTSLWVKISVAVLMIVLLFIAVPNMFGQGFSSIDSKFCLAVDTDEDGVVDQIELLEKRCVCNEDIPSKQFYVLDDRIKAKQQLFPQDTFPDRISYEAVMRIGRYMYEKEACNAQGNACTSQPELAFKDAMLDALFATNRTPDLGKFCYSKTGGDCNMEDFKEDFFVKDSSYTFKTECEINNDEERCKQMREDRCAEEKAAAEAASRESREV